MDWICGNVSGATMTCMRDKLPGEIGGTYHHKKKDSFDRIKVARLFNIFVATNNKEKIVEKRTGNDGENVGEVVSKAFKRVHVSFQSTSSCKTSTLNALNYCKTSAIIRTRGQFDNRRYWRIEMNEAHQIYLGTY